MRGRLVMAGVGAQADLGDVLDVLTVVMLEIPEKYLTKWRQLLDRAEVAAKVRAGTFDRKSWGLEPEQIEQQRAAMRTLGQGRR